MSIPELHNTQANHSSPSLLLQVQGAVKHFGQVRALDGCDVNLNAGEILGLIGHNGAGKSTLVNILVGLVERDVGKILFAGEELPIKYDPAGAFGRGIRCVFQELSLCGNLDAAENTLMVYASLGDRGWRRRARKVIGDSLQSVFPGTNIPLDVPVSELPIGERQMVEIARAFSESGDKPKMIILDEPTSSLDAEAAGQLMTHIRKVCKTGLSVILISHKLGEVARNADRIVVMRDGAVAAVRSNEEFNDGEIFRLMGGDELKLEKDPTAVKRLASASVILEHKVVRVDENDAPFMVKRGEVIGLAGLDGHGQRDLLLALYSNRARIGEGGKPLAMSYTSGDRQREGAFTLWSIARNISIGALSSFGRFLIPVETEEKLASKWYMDLKIRASSPNIPIVALSGGNQQKVLLARAFASESEIMLLDDPTRGVDLGTKRELYARIGDAARDDGKSVVWYSTESEELVQCDRVYVLHRGVITAELTAAEFDHEAVVKASFAETGKTRVLV